LSLKKFVTGGAEVRFTVGVDIENTSKEGLEDLLSLCALGDCKTYVYHNELSSATFHPKVYLFRNKTKARLLIGSNNVTQSGLFTNTEVSLQIDVPVSDRVIVDTRKALASWRDSSEGLARELDPKFLAELVTERYVLTEDALRQRRQRSERSRSTGRGKRAAKKLFGTKVVTAPIPPETRVASGARKGKLKRTARRVTGLLKVRGYRNLTVT